MAFNNSNGTYYFRDFWILNINNYNKLDLLQQINEFINYTFHIEIEDLEGKYEINEEINTLMMRIKIVLLMKLNSF